MKKLGKWAENGAPAFVRVCLPAEPSRNAQGLTTVVTLFGMTARDKVTNHPGWGLAVLAGLMMVLTGCSAASPLPGRDGQVVGGIAACTGARELHRPGFVAGTVRVLRGTVSETPTQANGDTTVLPTDQVASAHVAKLQKYRFTLKPGRYVLVAHYARSNIVSWVAVLIRTGKVTNQSIPTPCI